MARAAAAVVLQPPHHGWPWHIFRVADGDCCFPALAWQAVSNTLGAVAADVELPVTLHCEYSWMDDRGNRASTLDHLRRDANVGGLFKVRLSRQRFVHPTWLHGHVHGALHSLYRLDLPDHGERAASRRAGPCWEACFFDFCVRCRWDSSGSGWWQSCSSPTFCLTGLIWA